jgi:hypothetical protein
VGELSAATAAHLIDLPEAAGQAYNVAVNAPVRFEEALDAYMRALRRTGDPAIGARLLARLSALAQAVLCNFLQNCSQRPFVVVQLKHSTPIIPEPAGFFIHGTRSMEER